MPPNTRIQHTCQVIKATPILIKYKMGNNIDKVSYNYLLGFMSICYTQYIYRYVQVSM